MTRAGLIMVLLLAVTGCARWVPVSLGTAPTGSDVRLRLSEEGAQRLEDLTGRRAVEVTGELLQWQPEVLLSTALTNAGTGIDPGLRQRLVVDPDDVLSIDVREVDRTRTGLLAGGVVAVAASAIAWAVVNIIQGSEGAPSTPPADVPSEPFVRLRFP